MYETRGKINMVKDNFLKSHNENKQRLEVSEKKIETELQAHRELIVNNDYYFPKDTPSR